MYDMKKNLTYFSGIYILFLIGFFVVIELLAEAFNIDVGSSLGLIVMMVSASYVSQKIAERTGEEPSKKYNWVISVYMGLLGSLYGVVISFVYIVVLVGIDNLGTVARYFQQEVLKDISDATVVLIIVVSITLAILIARLGWGLGLHAGLKRWHKNEIKRIK